MGKRSYIVAGTIMVLGVAGWIVGRPDQVMQVLRRDAPGQPVVGIEMP